jgi:hypothetical protein
MENERKKKQKKSEERNRALWGRMRSEVQTA